MRYSVYVSGRMSLAYYSPAGNDRVLQHHCCVNAFAVFTIALPEMTGFYNPILSGSQYFRTIALPETAGL